MYILEEAPSPTLIPVPTLDMCNIQKGSIKRGRHPLGLPQDQFIPQIPEDVTGAAKCPTGLTPVTLFPV